MTREEMQKQVAAELEHIPDWPGEYQAELRMYYHAARLNSLGKNPEVKQGAKGVLRECLGWLRKHHPGDAPLYDKEYFGDVDAGA